MSDRIGFSTTNSALSRTIRRLTKSKASHAWILYYDQDFERDMVLEATLTGLRIVPFETFKRQNNVVDIVIPEVPLNVGFRKAGEQLGKRYDFGGLLGMVFVLIGRWLRKRWRNPFNSAKALFCSELVAQVLRDSYHPGTEYWDVTTMTPEDLYQFFCKRRASEAPRPDGIV